MPSELERMPSETHASMLRRGASRPLGLQAYEVAEYQKPGFFSSVFGFVFSFFKEG